MRATSCALQDEESDPAPKPLIREPTLAPDRPTPRLADFRPVDSDSR